MKKTKIVASVGPASNNEAILKRMMISGMDVLRINFTHTTHEDAKKALFLIKTLNQELSSHVATIADTKGPRLQTHLFEQGEIYVRKNDIITITFKEVLGNNQSFSINYPELFDDCLVGTTILVDEGYLQLIVIEKDIKQQALIVMAKNNHMLKNKSSVYIPNQNIQMPFISKEDEKDIAFICENAFDFIAVSYVKTAEDIRAVRRKIELHQRDDLKIIAKIENQESMRNLKDIIEVSDGIMILRNGLISDRFTDEISKLQREMIELCRKQGKVVLAATQMLESMRDHIRPTRAEISDIANAVYDGCDGLVLSGETASGMYPNQALEYLTNIAFRTEKNTDYQKFSEKALSGGSDVLDMMTFSAISGAKNHYLKAIICYGVDLANSLSKYRSAIPVIAVVDHLREAKQLSLSFGVYPVIGIKELMQKLKRFDYKNNDPMVILKNQTIEYKIYYD